MIISVNDLNKNGYTREEIVNAFCENLMNIIIKKNANGERKTVFYTYIYANNKTGEISPVYRKDWEDYSSHKYQFDDYADDIKKKFIQNGYIIKPTGYIGGVWQLTEDIMW